MAYLEKKNLLLLNWYYVSTFDMINKIISNQEQQHKNLMKIIKGSKHHSTDCVDIKYVSVEINNLTSLLSAKLVAISIYIFRN
jgi:hypothetical protein